MDTKNDHDRDAPTDRPGAAKTEASLPDAATSQQRWATMAGVSWRRGWGGLGSSGFGGSGRLGRHQGGTRGRRGGPHPRAHGRVGSLAIELAPDLHFAFTTSQTQDFILRSSSRRITLRTHNTPLRLVMRRPRGGRRRPGRATAHRAGAVHCATIDALHGPLLPSAVGAILVWRHPGERLVTRWLWLQGTLSCRHLLSPPACMPPAATRHPNSYIIRLSRTMSCAFCLPDFPAASTSHPPCSISSPRRRADACTTPSTWWLA